MLNGRTRERLPEGFRFFVALFAALVLIARVVDVVL